MFSEFIANFASSCFDALVGIVLLFCIVDWICEREEHISAPTSKELLKKCLGILEHERADTESLTQTLTQMQKDFFQQQDERHQAHILELKKELMEEFKNFDPDLVKIRASMLQIRPREGQDK